MCMTTFGTLTLAAMLDDPLIRAVMQSDNVSEDEHEALLTRVKHSLEERSPPIMPRTSPMRVEAC